MNYTSATVILALILTVAILFSAVNCGQMIYTLSMYWDELKPGRQVYGVIATILSFAIFILVAWGGSSSLVYFRSNYKACKSVN